MIQPRDSIKLRASDCSRSDETFIYRLAALGTRRKSRSIHRLFELFLGMVLVIASTAKADTLEITRIRLEGTNILIEWRGGVPPFRVQAQRLLTASWNDIASEVWQRFLSTPLTGDITVYRVASETNSPAEAPVLAVTALECDLTSLSWEAPQDPKTIFSRYRIFRDGQWIGEADGTSHFWIDQNLSPQRLYSYTLVGRDRFGADSSPSLPAVAETPDCKYAKDSGISIGLADLRCDWVMLWWDTDDAHAGQYSAYNVYRNGKKISQVSASATFWVDSGLTGLTTYVYSLRGVNQSGEESALSAPVRLETPNCAEAPDPGVTVSASVLGCQRVVLWWVTDGSHKTNYLAYNFYRDGNWMATVSATNAFWIDETIDPSTVYQYTIRGLNDGGSESPASSPAAIRTPECQRIPDSGIDLDSATVGCDWIMLWWSLADDHPNHYVGFKIYRDGNFIEQVAATASCWSDRAVTPGTQYLYSLRGVDKSGAESRSSRLLSATSLPCSEPNASGISLAITRTNCSWLIVSWDPDSNHLNTYATYRIYRDSKMVAEIARTNCNYWVDRGLSPNQTYQYSMTGIDKAGKESIRTEPRYVKTPVCGDVGPAEIPLAGLAARCDAIALWWETNGIQTDKLGGNLIYRNDILVAVLSPDTQFWIDLDCQPTLPYEYRLSAVFKDGREYSWSAPLMIVTPKCPETSSDSPLKLGGIAVRCDWIALWWPTNQPASAAWSGFRIFRNGIPLTDVASDEYFFVDKNLSPSTTNLYSIAPLDSAREVGSQSDAVAIGTGPCEKDADVGVVINGTFSSCDHVTLQWRVMRSGTKPFVGYKVYRDGVQVARVEEPLRFWIDENVTPYSRHSYWIIGLSVTGDETYASDLVTLSVPPCDGIEDFPGSLQSMAIGCRQVVFGWSATPDGDLTHFDAFRVYADGRLLGQTTAPTNVWVDTTVSPMTSYRYSVIGLTSDGRESKPSSPMSVLTSKCEEMLPFEAALVIHDNQCRRIELAWGTNSAGSNAFTAFQIYRGGVFVGRVLSPTNYWTDTSIEPQVPYEYRVSGVFSNGLESKFSEPLSLTSVRCNGSLPEFGAIVEGRVLECDGVDLAWGTDSVLQQQFVGYRVYRDGLVVGQTSSVTNLWEERRLKPSTSYRYEVVGLLPTGTESAPSNPLVLTTPSCDTNVTTGELRLDGIGLPCSGVALWWVDEFVGSNSFVRYHVYRDGLSIATLDASTNHWIDLDANPLTTYRYEVASVDKLDKELGVHHPLAITTPECTNAVTQDIVLAWDGASAVLAGYTVHYGVASGIYFWHQTVLGQQSEITIRGLISGVTYYFAVTSFDANGKESQPSDELVYSPP